MSLLKHLQAKAPSESKNTQKHEIVNSIIPVTFYYCAAEHSIIAILGALCGLCSLLWSAWAHQAAATGAELHAIIELLVASVTVKHAGFHGFALSRY